MRRTMGWNIFWKSILFKTMWKLSSRLLLFLKLDHHKGGWVLEFPDMQMSAREFPNNLKFRLTQMAEKLMFEFFQKNSILLRSKHWQKFTGWDEEV